MRLHKSYESDFLMKDCVFKVERRKYTNMIINFTFKSTSNLSNIMRVDTWDHVFRCFLRFGLSRDLPQCGDNQNH